MEYKEIWGVAHFMIEQYFDKCDNIKKVSNGKYRTDGFYVEVSELPDKIFGSMSIHRTLVFMKGDDKLTEKMHKNFSMYFLSAGG